MQISPILWLAAAVGFLALEASTFNMTSIWFAIGSAAALLCCSPGRSGCRRWSFWW